ncbi:MAG: glyoxylate/hydroxypyruvate reductase A [Burkholderiales bacterium PBB6]|nr:MAG: glyoxylate/hydroxypyruvate reductase A [Burkholderiales bacterium PBB6]
MTVYLCGNLDAADIVSWQTHLQAALPQERILTTLSSAERGEVDVAVVANPPAGSLQGLPSLRLIQSLWAGVDRLMLDSTLPPDVPVARMVDPHMNDAMAQTALWAVLSLHRGFFDYARQQAEACWLPLPQRRADEVRVSVLGLGQMGGTVARALQAAGYAVTGWRLGLEPPASPSPVPSCSGLPALPGLLASTDVLINLLPLTPATTGMLNAQLFARLPQGASVVNLARGAHLVEADLLAALSSGHISRAVLDVFATEPLPPAHAFWRHPKVTVLPHAAAATDPRSAAAVVAANVQALRAGRPLAHRVSRSAGY